MTRKKEETNDGLSVKVSQAAGRAHTSASCEFTAHDCLTPVLMRGGVPPHRLHHRHRVFATFEVGSDASIVARCASHQFVQKIRWRGRFGRPAGELHLLTEHRPASDGTNMATCAALLFSF